MSRPEVSLENYEAVYNYYENHTQNLQFARFGHFVMSKIYAPEVSYAENGAAEEAIREEFNAGRRILITPNHLTEADQYVLISLVKREEVFNPFIGNSFMPAKASLFMQPAFKGGAVLRRALDELGGIPIVRQEDIRRQGIELTPEIKELHRKAMLRADEVQVSKIIKGNHTGNFAEGTRNRVDHTQVQPLKKGFAYTACRAAEIVGVTVVPVGMYYGGEPQSYQKQDVPDKRKPIVHIGMPMTVETSSPAELVSQVYPAMQSCVDVAVRTSLARAA